MGEEGKSGGFWTTVPGILTAGAGLITAVTGLLLALHQIGLFGGDHKPSSQTATQRQTSRSSSAQVTPTPVAHTRTTGASGPDAATLEALDSARSLLRQQGPAAAARQFAAALQGKGLFGVVASDNCDAGTIRQAISVMPLGKQIVLPLRGTGCFRVACGVAATASQAEADCRFLAGRFQTTRQVYDGRVVALAP